MSEHYFAPAYLRLLYRFLQLPVEDEPRLFAGTSATAAEVMSADPAVSFADQMRLCSNALELVEPGLGLRMGAQLQLAAHGPLGTAMQNASSLDQALEAFGQFLGTRASFLQIERSATATEASVAITVQDLDEVLTRFFAESVMCVLDLCVGFFAGTAEYNKRVRFGHLAPRDTGSYRTAFHCAVEFGSTRTEILFPRDHLEMATWESDPDAYAEAIARCRLELERRHPDPQFRARAERFLRENPGKLWSAEDVAQLLNISARTFLRRLKDEGTSYQAVRDQVLGEQAEAYLRSMPVSAVALALGFADESSFRRAFRRWRGVAPGVVRRAGPLR